MATRFYLPATGTAAVTPSSNAALWDAWGAKIVVPLVTTKTSTAHSYQSGGFQSATPGNVLLAQYVSDTLSSGVSVAGQWTAVVQGYETNAAFNASLQMVIRVLDGAGTTVRGTVYAGHSTANNATAGSLGQEFVTGGTDQTRLFDVAGSSVSASAGDRIVIELGYRADYTTNVAYNAEIDIGDNQAADYTFVAGTTARTFDPWVETSENLAFGAAAAAAPIIVMPPRRP